MIELPWKNALMRGLPTSYGIVDLGARASIRRNDQEGNPEFEPQFSLVQIELGCICASLTTVVSAFVRILRSSNSHRYYEHQTT